MKTLRITGWIIDLIRAMLPPSFVGLPKIIVRAAAIDGVLCGEYVFIRWINGFISFFPFRSHL
jgi:hypothetical protein